MAELALAFTQLAPFARPALVNGAAGIVAAPGGRLASVLAFTVTEQDRRDRHPRRSRAPFPASRGGVRGMKVEHAGRIEPSNSSLVLAKGRRGMIWRGPGRQSSRSRSPPGRWVSGPGPPGGDRRGRRASNDERACCLRRLRAMVSDPDGDGVSLLALPGLCSRLDLARPCQAPKKAEARHAALH